jgi:Amt family ammonium transporter
VTTTLSAAAGALSGLFLDTAVEMRRTGHTSWDLVTACNCCLAGLVAISGGSQIFSTWASVLIGTLAGWSYYAVDKLLLRFKIDDPVGAIPVHLGGGILGVIATGLFANPYYMSLAGLNSAHPGWFYSWGRGSGDANLLLCELCLLLYILAWVSILMVPFYLILKATDQLRIDPDVEKDGCDLRQHRILPKRVEPAPTYNDDDYAKNRDDGSEKQLSIEYGEVPGAEK